MTNQTAILLFSRSATSEAKHKQLVGGFRRNCKLLERMISRTMRLARRTNLPVFQLDERQQTGHTFGEKINNAASQIAAKGFQNLIIIGSDTPQLRLADLRKAQQELEAGQSVIGPDRRGGAYLIGVSAHQLGKDFARLPWKTKSLCTELANFLTTDFGGRKVQFVRCLDDVNDGFDLTALIGLMAGKSCLSFLVEFIQPASNSSVVALCRQFFVAAFGRRGPPICG